MFDFDALQEFAQQRAEATAAGTAAREAAGPEPAPPKSREERLREFYAGRPSPASAEGPGPVALVATEGQGGALIAKERRSATPAEEEAALRARQRGNDLYEAQDYEAAVEHYTTAIRSAPSAVLYSNRAAAYMALGWWDQALRDTRIALRKDPTNAKFLERHGRVLLAHDQLDEAHKILADLEAAVRQEQPQAAELPAGVRRLRWLAERARDPVTLEECRAVLEAFGSKAELVSPLGQRLRRCLSKALVARSDAIDNQRKIRPALPRNRRTEADSEEIEEITPLAEEALRVTAELLQDNPDDAEVRYWRSRALVRLGRTADAEQQLEKGLAIEPGHQEMQALDETLNVLEECRLKGNAMYKEGNVAEAIRLYSLGLEKDPACADTRTCATLYYNRSAAHRRRGDFDQALEDANMSLVLHPKWCKALYRRGILLLECGRYAEALTELKVVQRADPTFDEELQAWLRRAHNWLAKPRGELNFYQMMRLPMDASKEDIRKQYHRLCLLWHPDKSDGTEECRQRFEDLQKAYRFLMDDEQRERYDFGTWKDRPVRHHTKRREKVKDHWDDTVDENEVMPHWYDECLLDDKVDSIYWGEHGPPSWLKEKRRQFRRERYGEDAQ